MEKTLWWWMLGVGSFLSHKITFLFSYVHELLLDTIETHSKTIILQSLSNINLHEVVKYFPAHLTLLLLPQVLSFQTLIQTCGTKLILSGGQKLLESKHKELLVNLNSFKLTHWAIVAMVVRLSTTKNMDRSRLEAYNTNIIYKCLYNYVPLLRNNWKHWAWLTERKYCCVFF